MSSSLGLRGWAQTRADWAAARAQPRWLTGLAGGVGAVASGHWRVGFIESEGRRESPAFGSLRDESRGAISTRFFHPHWHPARHPTSGRNSLGALSMAAAAIPLLLSVPGAYVSHSACACQPRAASRLQMTAADWLHDGLDVELPTLPLGVGEAILLPGQTGLIRCGAGDAARASDALEAAWSSYSCVGMPLKHTLCVSPLHDGTRVKQACQPSVRAQGRAARHRRAAPPQPRQSVAAA